MAESQQAEDNNTSANGNDRRRRIIVQGGGYCGRVSEHDLREEYEKVTKDAVKKGYDKLKEGGSAVDAVETAVSVFEESDFFNAGRGSALNCHGEVECDALIMDGNTMNTGAVMAVRRFINPVKLARKVMDDGVHCALSGDGALEFAREINFPICNPKELKGKNPNQKLDINNQDYQDYVRYRYAGEPLQESWGGDTVSAVAMDDNGHLACATSSGGIAGKRKGRVGDVPLVGCGGYANKYGVATTTGHGESIMKMTLARDVVYRVENAERIAQLNPDLNAELNVQKSSEEALKEMEDCVNGRGGVIAIDKNGNFGIAFNTTEMVWASIKDGKLEYGVDSHTPDESKSEQIADV